MTGYVGSQKPNVIVFYQNEIMMFLFQPATDLQVLAQAGLRTTRVRLTTRVYLTVPTTSTAKASVALRLETLRTTG